MAEAPARLDIEDLQRYLRDVQALLGDQERLPELRARLDALHPADIAQLLEALPLDERLAVWNLVKADRDGDILLEVSEAVRESLIATMEPQELVAATGALEADQIADLAPDLPEAVVQDVIRALPQEERDQLRAALSYAEGTVGALMDFDQITVRDDATLEAATRTLRGLDELPGHTDQLFVVDREQRMIGTLPLARLIVADLPRLAREVMVPAGVSLHPENPAADAAQAFERYDLVSAPVIDHFGRLIGRLTVKAVVDYIRQKSSDAQLAESGLRAEEDIFAPVLDSFKNRWSWLAINLVTAFIASRVIGVFEGAIASLVALAALMPIVAGIGGNSGNQTITMIVRAMALGQIAARTWQQLLAKELGVAALNGVVWGTLLGVAAYLIYDSVALGGVLALAMILNLVLAALMGVAIPWLRARFGRDPAVGSSVLITACTDSGGFFIFLGLASLFLV